MPSGSEIILERCLVNKILIRQISNLNPLPEVLQHRFTYTPLFRGAKSLGRRLYLDNIIRRKCPTVNDIHLPALNFSFRCLFFKLLHQFL